MASGLPADQILPPKEAAVFKQVIKLYENKQHKAALKSCNAILKKFPNHGETLSMKGLTLSGMEGKKEEAYEFVKLGLTKSKCKSHVCWHVFGLLYRADRNYEQATKCYLNALNIDPDNSQILRDLALLQVQRADMAGFVQTRHKLLELKPSHKPNWMGFALAHHLNKDYSEALRILDIYDTSMTVEPFETKYEASELLLYRNMIIFESGDIKGALRRLEADKDRIVDKVAVMELKAQYYIKLEKTAEAHAVYLDLLRANPENRKYLLSYVQTGSTPIPNWTDDFSFDIRDALVIELLSLEQQLPNSNSLKRVVLDIAYGELFVQRLQDFIKPYLRKTIPSLFSATKSLYSNADKISAMSELFSGWEKSLESEGKFPGEETVECPSTFLWVLMLQSSHAYRTKDYEKALKYIDAAIAHTPTVEMLYILKGRILKHTGNLTAAWESIEKARLLDVADRYMNTKSTKYLLRNNKIKQAADTFALFTTPADETPNFNVVEDMQCMWYEIEEANAYVRLGDILSAMKKWLTIDKHFQDIDEDQFDFHTYCLRKFTMRSYVEMMRFEYRAQGNKVYLLACQRLVKGYLEISESLARGEDLNAKTLHLFPKKKDDKKKKEAKKKSEDEEEEEEEEAKKEVHVDLKDPLNAAAQFLTVMQKYASQNLETHILGSELNLKRNKPLLALKSIAAGLQIEPQNEKLKQFSAKLLEMAKTSTEMNEHVKATIISNCP